MKRCYSKPAFANRGKLAQVTATEDGVVCVIVSGYQKCTEVDA